MLIAVIGSLTFLPATLAILGDGLNRLRLPILGRDREEGSGLWARIVRSVMRHPLPAALLAGAFLLVLASPALRLRLGQADFTSFPDSIDSVQALNILNEKWPTGTTLSLDVVVTHADDPATKAAIEDLTTKLLADPRRDRSAHGLTPSADGHAAMVSFIMSGGSERRGEPARSCARSRQDVVPAVFGGLPGVQALVSGDAAYTYDVVGFYSDGMPMVIGFVLFLSFLLLLVAFRSLVIPIKAILLNLLSTAAAFGLLVLVFEDGNLGGLLGFKPGPDRGVRARSSSSRSCSGSRWTTTSSS